MNSKPSPAQTKRPARWRAALVTGLAFAAPARGQDAASSADGRGAAAADAQRVVVTGTRASLAKSLERKRAAAGVQDSVSATELGRFPDDDVADSLSHVNGISITRTTGGEGLAVGVRGLGAGYNVVTMNGRVLATDGDGRDFAFDVLPSDVLVGADVLKSARASQVEGSIGGTVDLRTARPLGDPGSHLALRAEGGRNAMSHLAGRKVSGVASRTSEDGRFGALFGAVFSSTHERTDALRYENYDAGNPGSLDLDGEGTISVGERGLVAPCCIAFGSIFETKKRWALSSALEWQPTPDVHLVLDGLATRLESPQAGQDQAYYVQYAPGRWRDVHARNGLVTDMTVAGFVPEIANVTDDRVVDTRLAGLGGEWKLSSAFTLRGDVYRSRAVRDEGGKDSFVVAGIAGDNTLRWHANPGALPDLAVTLADGRDLAGALAAGALGDVDYGPHYVGLSGANIHDTLVGTTAAGHWSFANGRLASLDFGLARTRRDKTRDFIGNDWTGGACQYCDQYGLTFAALGAHVIEPIAVPDFMPKAGGAFPRGLLRLDVPAYLAALRTLDGRPVLDAHGRPTGDTFDFAKTLPRRDPTNSYVVRERSTAAWLEAGFEGEAWSADAGLRLVHTATSSATAIAAIVGIEDPTPEIPTSSPRVDYSPPVPFAQRAAYTRLLPSANLVWRIAPPLQLRLGAARVMARPALDQLAPTRSDTTTDRVYTITVAGDARLAPAMATQEDVSLEWFYRPQSALTLALFAKQVTDFVTTRTQTGVDIGLAGRPYTVVTPINGDEGRVTGLELGWQHLGDNGFGMRAQYTRNRSRAQVLGQDAGPLEGVAPATSSLGLLYEKDGVAANLSFDHTARYVVQHATEAGLPEIAAPSTWVTASVSYELARGLALHVEGKNLSNSVYRSTLGRDDAPYGYAAWGRTVTVGMSWKFDARPATAAPSPNAAGERP